MTQHYDPVPRDMRVRFECMRAGSHGAAECTHAVLRLPRLVAAVRDDLGHGAAIGLAASERERC